MKTYVLATVGIALAPFALGFPVAQQDTISLKPHGVPSTTGKSSGSTIVAFVPAATSSIHPSASGFAKPSSGVEPKGSGFFFKSHSGSGFARPTGWHHEDAHHGNHHEGAHHGRYLEGGHHGYGNKTHEPTKCVEAHSPDVKPTAQPTMHNHGVDGGHGGYGQPTGTSKSAPPHAMSMSASMTETKTITIISTEAHTKTEAQVSSIPSFSVVHEIQTSSHDPIMSHTTGTFSFGHVPSSQPTSSSTPAVAPQLTSSKTIITPGIGPVGVSPSSVHPAGSFSKAVSTSLYAVVPNVTSMSSRSSLKTGHGPIITPSSMSTNGPLITPGLGPVNEPRSSSGAAPVITPSVGSDNEPKSSSVIVPVITPAEKSKHSSTSTPIITTGVGPVNEPKSTSAIVSLIAPSFGPTNVSKTTSATIPVVINSRVGLINEPSSTSVAAPSITLGVGMVDHSPK